MGARKNLCLICCFWWGGGGLGWAFRRCSNTPPGRQAFRGAEDQRPSGGPRPRGARSPGRGRDGRAQVPPGPPGPPGVRQGVQGGQAQGAFGARPEPRPGQSPSQARSASGARTSSPGSPGSRTTRSRRAASTRRDGSQAASKADGAYQAAPPKNRIAKYGGVTCLKLCKLIFVELVLARSHVGLVAMWAMWASSKLYGPCGPLASSRTNYIKDVLGIF